MVRSAGIDELAPSESRLASWIGLTILLGLPLAAAILAFLAMQFPAHPSGPWLYWLAGLSAAMLGAAILEPQGFSVGTTALHSPSSS